MLSKSMKIYDFLKVHLYEIYINMSLGSCMKTETLRIFLEEWPLQYQDFEMQLKRLQI